MENNNIEVNDDWHEKLMSQPFISCKFLLRLTIVQNTKAELFTF